MAETILFTTLNIEEFKLLITDTVSQELRKQLLTVPPNKSDSIQFTRKETAAMLKVSLSTLNIYTKKGKIEAHKIGRRILYKKSSIDAALSALNMKPYKDDNHD